MDIKMLQTTGLFQGMSKEEVSLALTALEAAEKSFRKGETILHAGSVTRVWDWCFPAASPLKTTICGATAPF